MLASLFSRLRESSSINPDLIIFSGDLVRTGSNEEFLASKNEFLNRLAESTNVSADRIIFCPGNHDIDRDIVRKLPYIETGLLQTLQTRDEINSFIDLHWSLKIDDVPPPFKRLEKYYKAIWNENPPELTFRNLFVSIYNVSIHGRQIGIASFNTAWRCTGEPNNADRGNLVLGERVVDHAIEKLSHVDTRLAVFHHPLDWLHQADEAAVAGRLMGGFDVLFCGHIHRALPSYRMTTYGDAALSQAGCLYENRDYFNGFNNLEFDFDASKLKISIEEYSDQRRTFFPGVRIVDGGNIIYPLQSQSEREGEILPSLIRQIKPAIRKLANEQISLDKKAAGQLDIDKHFVCPPLRRQSRSIQLDPSEENEVGGDEVDRLLHGDSSFAIIGRSEFGKTTLAHYLCVKASEGDIDRPRLPLVCRFSELKKGDNVFWRLVREYAAEVGDGKVTRSLVERDSAFIVVDDVDVFDENRVSLLQQCIADHPNVRWCLFVRTPAGSISNESVVAEKFKNFEILTLRELHRGGIRALSANYTAMDEAAPESDETFRLLMDQIERTGLPRSGYIVSLMIWAMQNKSQGEILNEAVLLQNLIDYILGRMDFTTALRKDFDFQSKSTVLQALAYHLKTTGEVQEKNEIVRFVIEFLSGKGLNYDAAEIVDGFINCGILNQVGNVVSFRYRRFQEFFIAGYLRDNSQALVDIKQGDNWLKYAKELDLYTARFRHESSMLDFAKNVIEGITVPDPSLSPAELDDYLSNGHDADFTVKQLRKMRAEPMTAKKVDSLLDKTERRMVRKREQEETDAGEHPTRSDDVLRFYVALEMYSEFIRNLEFADKAQKRLHLDLCLGFWEKTLRGWMSSLKEAIENINEDLDPGGEPKTIKINAKKRGASPGDWKKLISYVESVMKYVLPSVISELAYHNVGSEKLVDFIGEIADDPKTPDLRKVLCTFMLLELSAERAIAKMSAIVDEDGHDRWILTVMTHRLFAYYRTRPLAKNVRTKFENLLVTMEMKLSGKSSKGKLKGLFLTEVQKQAFQDAGLKEPESSVKR